MKTYYIDCFLDSLDGGYKSMPVSRETFIKYCNCFSKSIREVNQDWHILMRPFEMSTKLFNRVKKY